MWLLQSRLLLTKCWPPLNKLMPLQAMDKRDWSVRFYIRHGYARFLRDVQVDCRLRRWPSPEEDQAVGRKCSQRNTFFLVSYIATILFFKIKALAINLKRTASFSFMCLNIVQPHSSPHLLVSHYSTKKGDIFHCNQTLYNSVIMLDSGLKKPLRVIYHLQISFFLFLFLKVSTPKGKKGVKVSSLKHHSSNT